MQLNFFVTANERTVNLWKRHGFEIVGALPGVFLHPTLRYVDVFVMFRSFQGSSLTTQFCSVASAAHNPH